ERGAPGELGEDLGHAVVQARGVGDVREVVGLVRAGDLAEQAAALQQVGEAAAVQVVHAGVDVRAELLVRPRRQAEARAHALDRGDHVVAAVLDRAVEVEGDQRPHAAPSRRARSSTLPRPSPCSVTLRAPLREPLYAENARPLWLRTSCCTPGGMIRMSPASIVTGPSSKWKVVTPLTAPRIPPSSCAWRLR